MEERVKLLDEQAELVDMVEEYRKRIKEANKGKNKAVKELRDLIEQQDKLRQELAMFRKQSRTAEADLIIVRQEFCKIKNLENQIKNLVDVHKFQGNTLEAANSKVNNLAKEKISLVDEKAEQQRKLKELRTVNQNLEIAVENLKKDNKDLVNRLDTVARNVSRNVPEFAKEENGMAADSQDDSGKMRSLEEQDTVSNMQLMETKLAMSMNQQLFNFGKSSQYKQLELVTCGSQEEQLSQLAGREAVKQGVLPVSCRNSSTNNVPCRDAMADQAGQRFPLGSLIEVAVRDQVQGRSKGKQWYKSPVLKANRSMAENCREDLAAKVKRCSCIIEQGNHHLADREFNLNNLDSFEKQVESTDTAVYSESDTKANSSLEQSMVFKQSSWKTREKEQLLQPGSSCGILTGVTTSPGPSVSKASLFNSFSPTVPVSSTSSSPRPTDH